MEDNSLVKYLEIDETMKGKSFFEDTLIIKECDSWANFKAHILRLEKFCSSYSTHERIDEKVWPIALFRGQADASWKLQSTLERFAPKHSKANNYYRLVRIIYDQLLTCGLVDATRFRDGILNFSKDSFKENPVPLKAYLAYLRHLGFPSPLVDWSRSPYIAAFFAYNGCTEDAERVSIYVTIEKLMKGYSASGDDNYKTTLIDRVGPYMETHSRHFLQQSEYTVCATRNEDKGLVEFSPYPDYFTSQSRKFCQSWHIFKFILPASEKIVVLRELDKMNINSYSLFRDSESLLDTLFKREVEFDA